MQITGDILHLTVLCDECGLRVLAEHPRRDAFVDRLRHDIRPRSRDDVQSHVGGQIKKTCQIAQRVRIAVKIGHIGLRLMPQPRDIGRHGIKSGLFQQVQAVLPLVNRRAEVMKFPGMDEQRLIIQPELAVFCNKGVLRLRLHFPPLHCCRL